MISIVATTVLVKVNLETGSFTLFLKCIREAARLIIWVNYDTRVVTNYEYIKHENFAEESLVSMSDLQLWLPFVVKPILFSWTPLAIHTKLSDWRPERRL